MLLQAFGDDPVGRQVPSQFLLVQLLSRREVLLKDRLQRQCVNAQPPAALLTLDRRGKSLRVVRQARAQHPGRDQRLAGRKERTLQLEQMVPFLLRELLGFALDANLLRVDQLE